MWWLPVLGWAVFFIVVIFYSWLSLAKDRYYARVESARILKLKIPEEPWYIKIRWSYFKR